MECGIQMGKGGKNNSKLTPAEIRRFQAELLVKRNEILGDVASMENGALRRQIGDLSSIPIHLADRGTDTFEVDNTLGLMDSERKLVFEIDDALERIENGTYGICEGNGEPIPKGRLEAIPWARYCVRCAGRLESRLLKKETPFDDWGYDDELGDEQG